MLPWTLNSANVLAGGADRERMTWPSAMFNGKTSGKR